MNFPPLSTHGTEISLADLLAARENRAALQHTLLATHRQTLLSVTLTAMGVVKKNALLDFVFAECLAELTACFAELGVEPVEEIVRPLETGHEAFFVLPIDAIQLKQAMIVLEQQSPLARLWDLDVFSADGELLSRSQFAQSPRACLLCQQAAKQCARERRHSIAELQAEMQRRVQAVQFAQKMAKWVGQALWAEVNLTPKPGLVDQANSGAHRDMDIATFQRSCQALQPFWAKFVYLGMQWAEMPANAVLPLIRPLGLQAEQAMFQATNQINTHKGAIFIFGLVCAALGRLWTTLPLFVERADLVNAVCNEVAAMTQGITTELQNYPENQPLTHGVSLFRRYGLTGARGEAERGFPLVRTVFQYIPEWENQVKSIFSSNPSILLSEFDLAHHSPLWHIVLLWLLAHNQDTNLAHRGGLEGLQWVQQQAAQILHHWQQHHSVTALMTQLAQFDQECIARNLSGGGSADLLGLTSFFYLLTLRGN